MALELLESTAKALRMTPGVNERKQTYLLSNCTSLTGGNKRSSNAFHKPGVRNDGADWLVQYWFCRKNARCGQSMSGKH